ncbi:cobalt transporter [Nocardia yunnanensis]|uniref:Cobalt transporter n=1 Tax=Nocardia yunnanensis TaxID=2382165 RepID=A0A386Z4K1_9NOCA|nr:CbtA family protein [Nocardia yunnanensis]AYF72570.1 cobalt transporter [Nocardia yunnanensis]
MEKRIIGRGVLLGALGGLLAFVFSRILAEPIIDRAIDYETGRDDAQMALDRAAGKPMMDMGTELFTRGQQANAGFSFALIVFGAAMGALFAVVYYLALRRSGKITPRSLALLVSGGMFLTLYVVPSLKYPANPPAIGHHETTKPRTALYLGMIVISVVALVAAVWLGRKLAARLDNWTAVIVAAASFTVVMAVVMLVLPSLGQLSANRREYGDFATETPQPLQDPSGVIVYPGFPADDLYHFRLYSFAAQAILWLVIGVGFAWLAPRLRADRASEAAPVAA